jgi:hypothetical protein
MIWLKEKARRGVVQKPAGIASLACLRPLSGGSCVGYSPTGIRRLGSVLMEISGHWVPNRDTLDHPCVEADSAGIEPARRIARRFSKALSCRLSHYPKAGSRGFEPLKRLNATSVFKTAPLDRSGNYPDCLPECHVGAACPNRLNPLVTRLRSSDRIAGRPMRDLIAGELTGLCSGLADA